MKIVKGNKLIEISELELLELTKKFERAILDLGTGDGRFAYKTAIQMPNVFFVGMDPNQKQLEIYAKKINREKLENMILVLGSIELPPKELSQKFDQIYINLPWGSLLGGIANGDEKIIKAICDFSKKSGKIDIVLGYSNFSEPVEYERLQLEKIDETMIKEKMVPVFEHFGFELKKLYEVEKAELKEIDSSWAKKLTFGQPRKMFRLAFVR